MYVVYLGSDRIRIVEAKMTMSGKIKVLSLYSAIMPNDYLDNTSDKSFQEVASVIGQGFSEIGGKDKKVRVVLENGTIPFTEKILPTVSQLKTVRLIKNETFSDENLVKNNIVDFVEIERFIEEEPVIRNYISKLAAFLGKKPTNVKDSKKKDTDNEAETTDEEKPKTRKVKKSRVFFTYISRDIITHLQKLFKDLGYKLLSIDIYQNVMNKLITGMMQKQDKSSKAKKKVANDENDMNDMVALEEGKLPLTMILVEYKEDAVTILLFKNGKLAYAFRKTILAGMQGQTQAERLYFIAELSNTIREAIGFFRSTFPDIEFNGIYFTGVLSDFDLWGHEVSSKVAYDVHKLNVPDSVLNVDDIEFNEFSGAISGFIRK